MRGPLLRGFAACCALLFLSSCPGGSLPLPDDGDENLTEAREAMIERHNDTRLGAGLEELAQDSRLDEIAQRQAQYMASIEDITHDDASGDDVRVRADSVGYEWVLIGENVGYASTASQVYGLWLDSPGHYNNITQANRNRLLWTDPHVDGVKTGHTEAAGWCLIASAIRGERRLVSVVLGAASDSARAIESQKLLNYGFQAFDTVSLYQSGKSVTKLPVWKGAAQEVNAGFLADRHVTLAKGQADKLALSLVAQDRLIAPVQSGQRVGTVKVAFDGRPVAEFPLIALEDVPLASLWGRAWDTVRLWFAK